MSPVVRQNREWNEARLAGVLAFGEEASCYVQASMEPRLPGMIALFHLHGNWLTSLTGGVKGVVCFQDYREIKS